MSANNSAITMYDLITKKKHGKELSYAELEFMIDGFVSGLIPDYQMSAMLMAIYFRSLNSSETANLTKIMAQSGDTIDLSSLKGKKIDKHSTGGVGDKTTLIVSPIVASLGVYAPKMSGRGLGHTGGTADKLEAISNYRTDLSIAEFIAVLEKCHCSLITQAGTLAKADKILYALRDVTATVDSLPLIASSIMSKKLASGSDGILLDVKVGEGAFMKTEKDARALAKIMVAIGKEAGTPTAALITDMNEPLGRAIGNSLEVIESIEVLKGQGPDDLVEISLRLASEMLVLAGLGTSEECLSLAKDALNSQKALTTFSNMVRLHGGDYSIIKDTSLMPRASFDKDITAPRDGYIVSLNAEKVGRASVILGAGRAKKDDALDYTAGIYLHKKCGDKVAAGDKLLTLYANDKEKLTLATARLQDAVKIADYKPKQKKLIYGLIN